MKSMNSPEIIAAIAGIKADLVAQGRDLSGVGAFYITNAVAKQLGFLLLWKGGGNRAIPQPDGSLHAEGGAGYATDYIIDPATFYGYDLLGDGGGANTPQWGGPETAADMVARNQMNWGTPLYNWPPVSVVEAPVATEPVVPTPAVPANLEARLQAIEDQMEAVAEVLSRLYVREDPTYDVPYDINAGWPVGRQSGKLVMTPRKRS